MLDLFARLVQDLVTDIAQLPIIARIAVFFGLLGLGSPVAFLFGGNFLFLFVRIGGRMRLGRSDVYASTSHASSRKPRQSARARKRRGDEHLGPPETW